MLASQWVWQRTKSVSIPAEEQNAGRVVDYFYKMEFHITPRFFSDSNYLFFFEKKFVPFIIRDPFPRPLLSLELYYGIFDEMRLIHLVKKFPVFFFFSLFQVFASPSLESAPRLQNYQAKLNRAQSTFKTYKKHFQTPPLFSCLFFRRRVIFFQLSRSFGPIQCFAGRIVFC